VSTGWGLALVTKVAIVAVVIGLGAYNNRRLVPAAAREPAAADVPGAADEPAIDVHRRLARVVAVEAVALLAVVGVTAVLVTRSPAGSSAVPAVPAPTPAQTVRIDLTGGGTAEVTVEPGRTGTNTIEVVLRDAEGRIVDPVDPPSVELTQESLEVGPLAAELTPIYVGDYEATLDLSFPGEWTVDVRVRVSDFESVSGTAALTIAD
jgi:copper transport protein